MAPLPAGTVAFLFTDVEGSTRRWEAFPTAMAAVIAEHDALLRGVVAAHGGHVFKTVGDAVCAAFPEGTGALAAAVAAQRALAAASLQWQAVGGLPVRMAVHVGVAEPRDGDFFGPPLNRVARLLAAAHGGQILLSGAADEVVHGSLAEGVALRDLGRHRLKDLAGGERLFSVVLPDLPSEFPPPRTPEGRLHDLPTPPTALIGREIEIAAATAILTGEGTTSRLLTLTGPGGAGKTRLSLHLAATLGLEFADGARFVPLAAITDPDLVLPEIVAAVGARDIAGTPREQLQAVLRPQRLLLVLDNLEQVTAAAPAIANLLADCPNVVIVVTSREPLHLRGERELPVPPLALPPLAATTAGAVLPITLAPDAALAFPAVRLFAERAQAAKASFTLSAENAGAVASLCARLDGLPLAIELAAARVRLLPPAAILARLDQRRPSGPHPARLDLLAGGPRDLPARHQTMRDTIAWSYDLLDPDEQVCFRRLAIFIGGCTLDAAERVPSANGFVLGETLDSGLETEHLALGPEHLALVSSLADKSLLRIEEEGEGEPRIGMLETIREYGLERLAADPVEAMAVAAAHARFYLAVAEEAAPALDGPEQARWLGLLERDHANLRAAVGWLRERDPVAALRLAGALWRFWWLRGYSTEGRGHLDALLPLAVDAPASLRITALNGAGVLAECQGDYDRAAALHEESLALARALGDQPAIAWSLNNLGVVALNRGDLERADTLLGENLAVAETTGDAAAIARALTDVGQVAVHAGDAERAATLFARSLALFRGMGDESHIARALTNLGCVALSRDRPEEAIANFEESLVLLRRVGDKQAIAITLNNLADVARLQDDPVRAQALYQESLGLAQEVGSKPATAIATENLAALAQRAGDEGRAKRMYLVALDLHRATNDWEGIVACLDGLAIVASSAGAGVTATRLLAAAASYRETHGLPDERQTADDDPLAMVRQSLDPTAFAEAWASGRAIPLEIIVAEAAVAI